MAIEKRCAKKNTLKANSNALRKYKKTISLSLSKIQREVLVGTLLGDASMPLDRGRPGLRVQFAQTIARENYIWHLYDIFQNFVGTPPRVQNIRGGGARDRQCIRFLTYRHPDFQFYDDLFYPVDENKCRKKRVPTNLHEVLTSRALAYWFMDDGTYTFNRSQNGKAPQRYYRFSTHCFPLEDQKILIQALQDNFEIAATIQKDRSYYKLYIRSKSTKRFDNLIRPYIHPCFDYKL